MSDGDAITATQKRRFKKAVKDLNDLMAEIREKNPSANYYLAMSTLNLMLGPTHHHCPVEEERSGSPNYHFVAEEAILQGSSGGDW